MPSDISLLEFPVDAENQDSTEVFNQYLVHIANKKLRRYKQIIQYGGKEGQSYYGHVMDLVSVAEKLRPAIGISAVEMRCVLLALTIHDINKIPPWNISAAKGREVKYADAATLSNVQQELENLEVAAFFPDWRKYIHDIRMLALLHQEALSGSTESFDQRNLSDYQLGQRLFGPLKHLMKAADSSDNSHSANYQDKHETHLRDKLLRHINAAMSERSYRFVGHRLAELRGLFTNVLHNTLVAYFKEKYGELACIDLLYYPEGVNYLLDEEINFEWNEQTLREVAHRAEKRLAEIQLEDLGKFIKGGTAAIKVDKAALKNGASMESIFEVIVIKILKNRYLSKIDEYVSDARVSLKKICTLPHSEDLLVEQAKNLLEQDLLIPANEDALKRGAFVAAFRKFLEDYKGTQLRVLKQNAWTRIYQIFQLPTSNYPLYNSINSYKRGFFLARDLPELSLDEMKEQVLADLGKLEAEAVAAKSGAKTKKAKAGEILDSGNSETEKATATVQETGYLLDYLKRNLEVWDSSNSGATFSKAVSLPEFGNVLQQYADAKRHHKQCCHCGSPLKAEVWFEQQVPDNLKVQLFTNRLEGGKSGDPKRNVCAACRTQFILEKLAWRVPSDGKIKKKLPNGNLKEIEAPIFYLHLFPYTFFTQPMLRAWWLTVEKLKNGDHTNFFLDTATYFSQQGYLSQNNKDPMAAFEVDIPKKEKKPWGLGLPVLSDAMSNTPVLPIVAPGENYGEQFMLALEKAVVLLRWFECRAILSRSPVPPLNLAHQKIDEKYPVVLMVEGMPRNLTWLLPETSLYRQREREGVVTKPQHQFDRLCERLSMLHLLSQKLYYRGSKADAVPHDFAVAAADDELALFFEADRLIEKKVAEETGGHDQARQLSYEIAPILERLTKL